MTFALTLTVGTDATSGPYQPTYPAGARGFVAAGSNPLGTTAGSINVANYYGAPILAIANDRAVAPQFLLIAIAGIQDAKFLGTVTTPDAKTYAAASASFVISLVNGNYVSTWTWPIAAGAVVLANGTVGIGDTGDTLIALQGSSGQSTQINLSWANSGPTPPTNYLLYRGVGVAVPTLFQTLSGATLAYADTGLSANSQYQYYVVATYADGSKSTSLQLNLWTPASGISDTFNCNCEVMTPDGWTVDTLAGLRRRVLLLSGYAAQANNPPAGMIAEINELLADSQKQLYRQHYEKKQIRMYAWQMEPNIRYYNLTQDESNCRKLDPLSVSWVGFQDLNQAWYQLDEGIDPIMYTRAQISTGWPTNYEIRSCIEIFPAPKAPYTLFIKGKFGLDAFAADTDTTTIDAESIFLLTLGRFKLSRGKTDAQAILSQAANYTKYLVAGSHNTARYVPRTKMAGVMTPPRFLPLGSEPA